MWDKVTEPKRPNSQLKLDKFLRFYYHLTTQEWNKRLILSPLEGNDGNRAWEEPINKRTCVAQSIPHCLSAIAYGRIEQYNIYRTENKVIAYWPYGVEDAVVTRERWIITDEVFIHIGRIDIGVFTSRGELDPEFDKNGQCGTKEDLPRQRRLLKAWQDALKTNRCNGLKLDIVGSEKSSELNVS